MGDLVAILEDNPNRIAAMRACMDETLPNSTIVFFENAQEMIAWLGKHLGNVVFISLDHDLPMRGREGKTSDCGSGREVADYLASLPPTCPVIVHSSNDLCAPGMFFALKDAGWPCSRVYPCSDMAWVGTSWVEQVRRYLNSGWIKRT